MRPPIGPSLQMSLALTAAAVELTCAGIKWLIEACDGVSRAEEKLRRLERQGYLALESKPGSTDRVVRITESGRLKALGGRDPEMQWGRFWDGRWRMVIFDVPESKEPLRTRLRRRLKRLHFGYLQDSVWICPDPLHVLKSEIAEQRIDPETLMMFQARPCGGESDQEVVAAAWDFDKINSGYEAYMKVLSARPLGPMSTSRRRQALRKWFQREWKAWQTILRIDPMLPDPLLPIGYPGKQVWADRTEIFQVISKDLPD